MPISTVSVIIPCYNYGHFLNECLDSVLSQHGVALRILIIDDASTDDTPLIGGKIANRDQRVEFRRHTFNLGHIATYNEGLAWATGDYLLLLSADDMLRPGALFRAARLMDAHPEVGMTYGRQITLRPGQLIQETCADDHEYRWWVQSREQFIEASCKAYRNIVPTPTAVVRTRLQREIGGYRKELPHSGDMEMWLRIAAHAPLGFIDTEQAYYRIHTDNMNLRYADLKDLKQRKEAFDTLFREYGTRLAGSPSLQVLAERRLAEEALEALWESHRLFDRGETRTSRDYLEFALSANPGLKSHFSGKTMHWKHMMGPKVWETLRPTVETLRALRVINRSRSRA